jgi:hypothetical protein
VQLNYESEPVLPTSTPAEADLGDATPDCVEEPPLEVMAESTSLEDSAARVGSEAPSALLRAAYVLIFLVTLVAAYAVWPQAGGQGHLDLMPWYWKVFPPIAFSYSVVRASMAAGSGAAAWNRKSVAWLAMAVLFAGLIAGVTYYYHLTESQDQVDSDEGIITSVRVPAIRRHA